MKDPSEGHCGRGNPSPAIYVIGCGNILFGDDGFGPRVIEYLEKHYSFDDTVRVIDAGTAVRSILFDISLSEKKPRKIIIVDSVDFGRKPGTLLEIPVSELKESAIPSVSFHQLPTGHLLKELKEVCGVDVTIMACQVEHVPGEVHPLLSGKLEEAIPEICKMIFKIARI